LSPREFVALLATTEIAPTLETWTERLITHSRRVMGYSHALGHALGLATEVLSELRQASLLHDVGKSTLPLSILIKPSKLDAGEWTLVQQHPGIGAAIGRQLGFTVSVCAMVEHHHEHWDGSGYPAGLAGENIPLGARIICIADVFDALTSERSYRAPLTNAEALEVMRAEAGTVVDPYAYRVFQNLITRSARAY
jgi:putative nucleotidyltransferase with HDIG domain